MLFLILNSIDENGHFKFNEFISGFSIISISIILIFLFSFQKKIHFKRIDKDIFILSMQFLKETDNSNEEITAKLEKLFSVYQKEELSKLIFKFNTENPEIYKSCRNLADQSPEIKYYAIYSLMDLASIDGLYSLKEEEFIEKVRRLLKIHTQTFQYIKNAYLKKGLIEERKILEEQAQKSDESEYSLLDSYKKLGVTPDITIEQLKQMYRKLAMHYHPDRLLGQDEEIINRKEDTFNEITLAYKIILKHLKSG
jgi:DnaJ-domain-containing protein 1